MRTFSGLDDLAAAEGEHLGYSEWLEITQERVSQFADATGDFQWIHVDPPRAAESSFGGTIAHGYLTLGLLPAMMQAIFAVENTELGVNFGLGKVRFPCPVLVGAHVRGGAELTGAQGVPGGWLASVRMTVEIEHQRRPACVADTLSLFLV
jgi:acyl dehydratase